MRPQHFAALTGTLLAVAVVLLMMGRPQPEQAVKGPAELPRAVTVTGEGEVRVKPDLVWVTFGVWSHGASAAEAEALVLASVRRVQAAAASAGADDQFMERADVTITPTTHQDFRGTPFLTGFEARGTVRAVVRNTAKLQAVVDAGLSAGATSVGGFEYGLENAEPAKQAAMKAAVENARQRATALLKVEGERVGELRSIEVLPEDLPGSTGTAPGALYYRATVRVTFDY